MSGETTKAHARRCGEGWYDHFIRSPVIDIGAGDDPLPAFVDEVRRWFVDDVRRWDKLDGDATFMAGVADQSFATVYASHVLEHLADPAAALSNWWRILKPGGFLIVVVPHCDLYEKQRTLPSRWNFEHKTLWLPCFGEGAARGLLQTIHEVLRGAIFHSLRTIDFGYRAGAPEAHPSGEYSIEAILRKSA